MKCAHGVDTSTHSCFACNHQPVTTCKHGIQVGGAKCPTCTVPGSLDEMLAKNPLPDPSVLLEAESLVNGDRAASYGDPKDNFRRWRDMCRATDRPALKEITAEDLAVVMICLKVCRDTASAKRDNVVDGAAYFELWNRVRGL